MRTASMFTEVRRTSMILDSTSKESYAKRIKPAYKKSEKCTKDYSDESGKGKKCHMETRYYNIKEESKLKYEELTPHVKKVGGFIKMTQEEIDDLIGRMQDRYPGKLDTSNEDVEIFPEKEVEFRTSSSDSEDTTHLTSTSSHDPVKYTSDASKNVATMIIYPPLDEDQRGLIRETKFASDPAFTLNELLVNLKHIHDLSELLEKMKKCLVFVVIDTDSESTWFAWTGLDVIRYSSSRNSWVTRIYSHDYSKCFTLMEVMNDFACELGFNLTMIKNLEDLLRESRITSTLLSITIDEDGDEAVEDSDEHIKLIVPTHIYIGERFKLLSCEKIKTGNNLYNEYLAWKDSTLMTTKDASLVMSLKHDGITSARKFTETFKILSETTPHDKFYRARTSGNRWYIHRNLKYEF